MRCRAEQSHRTGAADLDDPRGELLFGRLDGRQQNGHCNLAIDRPVREIEGGNASKPRSLSPHPE